MNQVEEHYDEMIRRLLPTPEEERVTKALMTEMGSTFIGVFHPETTLKAARIAIAALREETETE